MFLCTRLKRLYQKQCHFALQETIYLKENKYGIGIAYKTRKHSKLVCKIYLFLLVSDTLKEKFL